MQIFITVAALLAVAVAKSAHPVADSYPADEGGYGRDVKYKGEAMYGYYPRAYAYAAPSNRDSENAAHSYEAPPSYTNSANPKPSALPIPVYPYAYNPNVFYYGLYWG